MKFEAHCKQAETTFGNKHERVHKWLDELAGKPPHGMKHRQFRHHQEGVEQVKKMWGAEAALAATQHIMADLQMEGWVCGDPFPVDTAHYNRMGLF